MVNDYEALVEWRIKRIPPPEKEPRETYDDRIKEWVLNSMGIDETVQSLYTLIETSNMVTIEDMMSKLGMDEQQLDEGLDQLYSAGLIEKLGKAYYVKDKLSTSIVNKLIPRINESLRTIASVESASRSRIDPMLKLRGKSFNRISEAIAAYKWLTREGMTVRGRAIGVQAYSDELIEVEGLLLGVDTETRCITLLTETGEKMMIGDKHARGVDVKAQTVIIRGVRNE
jgi:hypothetical protein